MNRLGWIGASVFALTMTLTSATVGGAVVGGCTAFAVTLGHEDGELTEPYAPAEAAREAMGPVGFVSTGLLTLLALLLALRLPNPYPAVGAMLSATGAGAVNTVVLVLFVGETWPIALVIAGIVGVVIGFTFGVALAVPTHFAARLIERPSRAELERSLLMSGGFACGLMFLATRVFDLALAPTALAVGIGGAAIAASLGSYASRRRRLRALRRASVELVPLDGVDVREATMLSDGPAVWAVVERDRAGYRERPAARWLLDDDDARWLQGLPPRPAPSHDWIALRQ